MVVSQKTVYPSYQALKLWNHLLELSLLQRNGEGPMGGKDWAQWGLPGMSKGSHSELMESDRILWIDTGRALAAITYLDEGLAKLLLWRLQSCPNAAPVPIPRGVGIYIGFMDWRCQESRFQWGQELLYWWLKESGEMPIEPECCLTIE